MVINNVNYIIRAALESEEEGLWDTVGTPAYSVTVGGELYTVVPGSNGIEEWWSVTKCSTGESVTANR